MQLLTGKEAAASLGVSLRTLENWRQRHKGPPYVKLESALVRYRTQDLETWLAKQPWPIKED